jgi:hypothetical protein
MLSKLYYTYIIYYIYLRKKQKMKRWFVITLVLIALFSCILISGCGEVSQDAGAEVGSVVGGAQGGYTGSKYGTCTDACLYECGMACAGGEGMEAAGSAVGDNVNGGINGISSSCGSGEGAFNIGSCMSINALGFCAGCAICMEAFEDVSDSSAPNGGYSDNNLYD